MTHGQSLIVKKPAYLIATNAGKWLRRWVDVEVPEGWTFRRVHTFVEPRGTKCFGPFEEGWFVSYSGHEKITFQVVDAPRETAA